MKITFRQIDAFQTLIALRNGNKDGVFTEVFHSQL